MKTKVKILAKALELFNAEGHEAVTTRQIAQALGMSQGNLCYHFPHKTDLVMGLYQQLVAEFDQTLKNLQQQEYSFEEAFVQTHAMLQVQYRYQFLMHDFVRIMQSYPEINRHFRALQTLRHQQLQLLFKQLNARGLAHLPLEGPAFQRLVEQYFIVGNAWMGEAAILKPIPEQDLIKHYSAVLLGLLYPWLNPAGQAAFDAGLKAFEKSHHTED
ncbi:MAG: TetR/AcrR family transcriptional regulator [Candidatus Sericytochromatia bacterium]